ncbi:MAG: hypothetical protein M1829_006790 [Trizodia sp. TS-e1964]|nr:MAG: hypothetical protein M1829_006790 [Trizodia sp. TS-e1964]
MSDHHHRSTTKSTQKSFKSRKSTKGALKERSKGKIEAKDIGRKTPHQQVLSKLERRNQARQRQTTKHLEHTKSLDIFSGRDGAPRIVAVVPLCQNANPQDAVRSMNAGLDLDIEIPLIGAIKCQISRFKQNIEYIVVNRDLVQALDACRIADFVLFILLPDEEVDKVGESILRSVEGQGVSNVFTVVQGLDKVEPAKRRPQIASSLKSYISHFFPNQEKVHSLDSHQECLNLVRSLCMTTPKGIRWRDERSWMLAETAQWNGIDTDSADSASPNMELVVTGIIRGRGMNPNRLVQIGDWGEYQIAKITAAPFQMHKKNKSEEMAIDCAETVLDQPSSDQEDTVSFAPEEAVMVDATETAASEVISNRKGVLLDDHHYFSDEHREELDPPKRLPKGTSSYQAAWYLDNISDSGSDLDELEDMDGDRTMDGPTLPQDGLEGLDNGPQAWTEAAPSEAPYTEKFLDLSPNEEAEQLAAFRSRQHDEADDDLEFPDEIELHPNVLARERLARYRGLKSLRTSRWKTDEDRAHQPDEWDRLLQVSDYKKWRSQVSREALVGGVKAGTRVNLHFRHVPLSFKENYDPSKPLALFSLLRHEKKHAVINYSITLSSGYPSPLKSKEEIIIQCGPRRFVANPLFSQAGNTPNNVHKYDRFLHPSRSAVATFIGPLTWGSVPVLYFKRVQSEQESDEVMKTDDINSSPQLELIATGTSLPLDHNRVIAKRAILTGHPYKIHKKLVTVRYMFFNLEDVQWFKALQLWTKRGRSGYLKESLGTHGYFKATFDGKINPQDSVGVSLYKRVFPRVCKPFDSILGHSG